MDPAWRALLVLLLCSMLSGSLGCGSGATTRREFTTFPPATVPLMRLSTDTFTNATSKHATEVEPDSFAFGSTIVAAFQVGRISGGGASDIGFAISTDAGANWQNGFLPGLTTFEGGGANAAASDPSVVYDAAHAVWMIASLTISSSGATQVVVSRSGDGVNWDNPILAGATPDPDKNWITCDNNTGSAFYGHCYLQWDDFSQGDRIWMSASSDGGLSWSAAANTAGAATGIGGQPLVQPNGNVVVPILGDEMDAFLSTDGGVTWTAPVKIADVAAHRVAGGMRTDPLPSAEMDAAGTVYVVWQDCAFRAGCSSNDLVMSTSTDGTHWSAKARIPVDPVSSGADHFIPGLGVDPTSSGSNARLGLTYYYFPEAHCTATTCALFVGFISSNDGGATWSSATPVAGPMTLSWLPSTTEGLMVGDYISTSFAGGKAFGVFAVAKAKSGTTFDEAIYTTQAGFDVARARRSAVLGKSSTVIGASQATHVFHRRIR